MARSYKTTCPNPLCNGNNFYVTEHNGMGYCFNCGHLVRDNEEHVHTIQEISPNVDAIRQLYTQAAHYYHSSLDSTAYDYLHQRGFTDQTIQDLQIGYCPIGKSPLYKGDTAKEAGLVYYDETALLGGRITFPYLLDDGTVTDIRGRSIDPTEEMKYKSLLGSSYNRGAIYPYNYHLRSTSNRILLTEGEIKADIAYQFKFPTMALPGMLNWRSGFIPDSTKEYVIVFDNQRDNFYQVRQAIMKAARKIPNAFVSTLPLLGKNKQDIDGFILEYGYNAFNIIVNGALPYNEWYKLQRF